MKLYARIKFGIAAFAVSLLGLTAFFTESNIFMGAAAALGILLFLLGSSRKIISALGFVLFFAAVAAVGGFAFKNFPDADFLSGVLYALCLVLPAAALIMLVYNCVKAVKIKAGCIPQRNTSGFYFFVIQGPHQVSS